jgi:methylmalonyl-CoA/ethylmalonyl-CoA epimerase
MRQIDHIAIAVPNLEEALKFYQSALRLECFTVETVAEQGVRVAKLDAGNTHIELLEPLGPDTPVGKFIAKHGPGLHHMCLAVDDINQELSTLSGQNIRLIDQKPRTGAGGAQIAFVHPASTGGVLLELSQPGQKGADQSHSG